MDMRRRFVLRTAEISNRITPTREAMNAHHSAPLHSEYDVIVAGGGPGGAALATFLARAGHRCLVLDQASFPRYHIGESLIPHTYGILDRLGLLPKMRS